MRSNHSIMALWCSGTATMPPRAGRMFDSGSKNFFFRIFHFFIGNRKKNEKKRFFEKKNFSESSLTPVWIRTLGAPVSTLGTSPLGHHTTT